MPPRAKKMTPTKKTNPKKKAIESLIQPIEFDEGIKINLYGRSGTGKTTLWSTFPKPILAIICSGGIKSGELRSISKKDRKGIDQAKIEKTSQLRELIDYQNETSKYATVVLDHASGLQDYTLREILGLEELPAQSSWGMAQQQQWGQCALKMKEMLRALLNLSGNVVIVAQEREFNTDGNDEILMPYVGSALSPSVTGWLNPACDYICQTSIRTKMISKTIKIGGKEQTKLIEGNGVEYVLRTAPHAVFTTKFRIPKGSKMPDVIIDPDYDKIMALINGAIE